MRRTRLPRWVRPAAMDVWTVVLIFLALVVAKILVQWVKMLLLLRDGMPSAERPRHGARSTHTASP